jgi:site-specific DNA-methyltransferase (adenine-specific)
MRSSQGFMGKKWDGGDIAMNLETWRSLSQHLLPGAFMFVFAGTLNDDLISVAMREAGLVKFHSLKHWGYEGIQLGWATGQGFPKATRLDKQIDFEAGKKRDIISTRFVHNIRNGKYINGVGKIRINITAPKTPLARAWAGHRYGQQALKPSLETILIFHKPYEYKPVNSIVEHGAGALNVDGGRINMKFQKQAGRWPANLCLSHSPDCTDSECVDGCPVSELDQQSGDVQGGRPVLRRIARTGFLSGITKSGETGFSGYNDNGGASRFFFVADYVAERLEQTAGVFYHGKTGRPEKDAGLKNQNSHPTIKPIALARWLASLLLPPDSYAPRRLLIPFAGSGSEMIGALLAGWEDVLGIEMEREYADIAKTRIAWWICQPRDIAEQVMCFNDTESENQLSFL